MLAAHGRRPGAPARLGPARPLLYQAGADPYREDPYSPLALDHDDLRERDRQRLRAGPSAQAIPIAWVLAGGYTKDTRKVVRVHLNTFDAAREVFRCPSLAGQWPALAFAIRRGWV